MYANGSFVTKGQPLFQIDPRPFQAAVNQAEGDLAQAKASLQQSQAKLGKTELDVARYTPLAKQSAISQMRRDGKCSGMLASWSVTSA